MEPKHEEGANVGSEISRRDLLRGTFVVAVSAVSYSFLPGIAFAQSDLNVTFGPQIDVDFMLNGRPVTVRVEPRVSLLDLLRERLDLTGTKKGCNQGACGACTVHMNGERILSCLTLAAQADGAEVTTIEGLADEAEREGIATEGLHPLQAAFIANDAQQCGYCTPGQIMAGVACIREGHATSEADIKEFMSGNLCRCGAHNGIVAAISEARAAMEG